MSAQVKTIVNTDDIKLSSVSCESGTNIFLMSLVEPELLLKTIKSFLTSIMND
jgi:hypothetical protein